jgi:hypothetical protein
MDARQYTQHARFVAICCFPGLWRLREKIPIASAHAIHRPVENAHLSFKPEYRTVDQRLSQQPAGVVYQIACGKIIGSIQDNIKSGEDLQGVLCTDLFAEYLKLHCAVHGTESLGSHLGLGLAKILFRVQYLPVQIGLFHQIEIGNPDTPYPGCRQVL